MCARVSLFLQEYKWDTCANANRTQYLPVNKHKIDVDTRSLSPCVYECVSGALVIHLWVNTNVITLWFGRILLTRRRQRRGEGTFVLAYATSRCILIFQQLSTLQMSSLPLSLMCVYKCTYLLQLFPSICVNGWLTGECVCGRERERGREVKFSCEHLTMQTQFSPANRRAKRKSKVTDSLHLSLSASRCFSPCQI